MTDNDRELIHTLAIALCAGCLVKLVMLAVRYAYEADFYESECRAWKALAFTLMQDKETPAPVTERAPG